MKATVHVTKEVETVDEAKGFHNYVKHLLTEQKAVHVNGQVTVKFVPSHPEGTPEEGPKS